MDNKPANSCYNDGKNKYATHNQYQCVIRLQERVWSVTDCTYQELKDRLSRSLDRVEGAEEGPFPATWEQTRFYGLFHLEAVLEGDFENLRLRYSCYQTTRLRRLQTAVLLAGCLVGGLILAVMQGWVGAVPEAVEQGGTSQTNQGVFLLSAVAILMCLAYSKRGPNPPFTTDRLECEYTTYSLMYPMIQGLVVLICSLFLGLVLTIPTLVVATCLFLFFLSKFTSGNLPAFTRQLGAGTPMFDRQYPHLTIAVTALLPAIVTLAIGVFASVAVPPTPQMADRPLVVSAVYMLLPIMIGFGYCYWCLRQCKRLGSKRLEPYRGRLGRVITLGIFVVVNFFITFATTTMLAGAGMNLMILQGTMDIELNTAGIGLVGGIFSGLLGLAVGGAGLQSRFSKTSHWASRVVRSFVRYANCTLLLLLFIFSQFLLMNLFGILVLGDDAIFDPSGMTLRTSYELSLSLADTLAPVPGSESLSVVVVSALSVFPVVVLGISWAIYINSQLLDIVTYRHQNDCLDTDGRPVPDGVDVLIVNENIMSHVDPSVLDNSRIFLGREFLQTADNDAEINAVLAHEVYHLRNQDDVVTLLSVIGSVFFCGQNALLAFSNLAESERAADRYAVKRVSREALHQALSTASSLNLSEEELMSSAGKATVGPGLLGSTGAISKVTTKLREFPQTRKQSGRNLWDTLRALLFAPCALLFGDVIYKQAHADQAARKALADLPDRIIEHLKNDKEFEQKTVMLPYEEQIIHPVPVTTVVDHFVAMGGTDEQVREAIDELIAADKIVEPRPGMLLLPSALT